MPTRTWNSFRPVLERRNTRNREQQKPNTGYSKAVFLLHFFVHSINIYRVRTIIIYFFHQVSESAFASCLARWGYVPHFIFLRCCYGMKCWDQAGLHWPFPRFTPLSSLSSLSSLPLSHIFSSPADWVFGEWKSTERIYTMTSFYYYDQNPSGFCFLVQIRAFVVEASLDYQI